MNEQTKDYFYKQRIESCLIKCSVCGWVGLMRGMTVNRNLGRTCPDCNSDRVTTEYDAWLREKGYLGPRGWGTRLPEFDEEDVGS